MNTERKGGVRQPTVLGNNSGNLREIQNGEVAVSYPPLVSIFKGIVVTSVQRTAMGILDDLGLATEDKRLLFFSYLWHESGSLVQVRRFGGADETVDGLLGRLDDRLSEKYDQFYDGYSSVLAQQAEGEMVKRSKAVLAKHNYTEVMEMKNKKTPHKVIAEALGIPLTKVHGIAKDLITAGLIEPSAKGRFRAATFAEFCDKVLWLRQQGVIDYEEVARRLGVSRGSVDRAIGRLSSSGRLKVFTKKELGAIKSRKKKGFREKVKSYRNNTDLSVEEIAVVTESTVDQVRIQISKLIRSGEIISQEVQDRKRKKAELRKILQSGRYRTLKGRINLKAAMKELGASFYSTRSLYDEIAQEETVPPRIRQVHKSSLVNPK